MGKMVFKNAVVIVDGTDLSDFANEVTVEDTADEVDVTGFGNNGYREMAQGLKDATITATFFQDFEAGSVEHILQPLYESGGTFGVSIKPTSATASDTNPWYRMTSRLYSFSPVGGAVGDALTVESTFRNAGDGITRGTSGTI